MFTPRGTFIIKGLERVPIVRMKSVIQSDTTINNKNSFQSDLKMLDAWVFSDQLTNIICKNALKYKELLIRLLDKTDSAERISLNPLTHWIQKSCIIPLFTGELCPILDDTNPLSEISLKRKLTTKRGTGKTRSLMPERRGVHASHYGRICLVETPESESIGLDLHLALAARIENKKILSPLQKDGNTIWLSPEEEARAWVVPKADSIYDRDISDQFLIRQAGEVCAVPELPADVYRDKYSAQFLGLAANLIPFVQHNDNNRVMMGAKNMKQALPLLFPEAPLIKTGREQLLGRLCGHAVFTRNNGYVKEVMEDKIVVLKKDGQQDFYGIQPIRPTGHRTITSHRPLVKKGDRVEEGQALADGACTVNGELALGVNLLVAYMPYYGLNFEDGIVISDRLVNEDVLTSLHLMDIPFDVYTGQHMESTDTRSEMNEFTLKKGVLCQVDQTVQKGDRLFVKYQKNESDIRSPERTYCHSPINGTIINILHETGCVNATGSQPVQYRKRCWILEKRKIEVGDKLMGRHGNKGVVARIIKSEKMPHLQDGTPVDVILNPHGVVSRMNLGQILETHMGWILHHGGEDFQHLATVLPFQSISEDTLQDAFRRLSHTGISETGKAFLIDGQSAEPIERPVVVGYQYIMKLNHMVSDKIHVRGTGPYTRITQQPVKGQRHGGGQRVGEMEVWALEAHLAWSVLAEMLTVKSDAPDSKRAAIDTLNPKSIITDETIVPETLTAAIILLRGMGIDLIIRDQQHQEIPIKSDKPDIAIHDAQIFFASEARILKWANHHCILQSDSPHIKRGKMITKPDGLYDPNIFSDSRYDMGYIRLSEPVIHPLLTKKVQESANKVFQTYYRDILGDVAISNDKNDFDISKTKKEISDVIVSKKVMVHNRSQKVVEFLTLEQLQGISPDSEIWNCFTLLEKLGSYDDSNFSELLKTALIRFIPVLPMDFRPLSLRQGNQIVSSDINRFYHQVLIASHALEKAVNQNAPFDHFFLLRLNMQNAVNRLMIGDKISLKENRKPISDMIQGKEGIFRKFLLGKRVDFSARSVIVPMPELEFGKTGIPLEIAVGVTREILLKQLIQHCDGEDYNEKKRNAQHIVKYPHIPTHRYLIEKILTGYQGILNKRLMIMTRAPSLHKYNLLSFAPVLTDHQAIGLHPLLCKMFNADFDGDQMAVHMPISGESMDEARQTMAPHANILSVANGKPILNFTQDIVLGLYHLSLSDAGRLQIATWFDNLFVLDEPVTASKLDKMLFTYLINNPEPEKRTSLLQKLMHDGFTEATRSGLTFSIFDTPHIPYEERRRQHRDMNGDMKKLHEVIENLLKDQSKHSDSPVAEMVRSGAKGGMTQIVQLGGMRGVMTDMLNREIETPVCRNYREGVSPLEFFIGSHASRRSMCEKKLITADAGAFTRRLVESAYRCVIREDDCGNHDGVSLYPVPDAVQQDLGYKIQFADRLTGRVLLDGRIIDEALAEELADTGQPVMVRSVMTCQSYHTHGYGALCRHCYGWDLSMRRFPDLGSPVGIIAGQSIGERGTQLAMQTFHTGGVGPVGITAGLPRIRKFFNNKKIVLETYLVIDSGSSNLEVNSSIDLWQWACFSIHYPELHVKKPDSSTSDGQPNQIKRDLTSSLEWGMDAMLLILHLEAWRTYKGAIHDRHFEVILKSMLQLKNPNQPEILGVFMAPFQQPGFLAAASYQSALKVLTSAALENRTDALEGYKEKIIMGKQI
jgi:DNA-directed RNA polymerase beta subunit/DNA-directed RNA polymerase beta' subunit